MMWKMWSRKQTAMTQLDWLNVAETTIRHTSERKIIRDSDGNPARLTYREGAAEAAALSASKQLSAEAAIDAISDTLSAYEVPVLVAGETLRTS